MWKTYFSKGKNFKTSMKMYSGKITSSLHVIVNYWTVQTNPGYLLAVVVTTKHEVEKLTNFESLWIRRTSESLEENQQREVKGFV